jgi:antitoxin MazE
MKTRIIPIGKSQAIRIPRKLLDQTGLSGEVEINAAGRCLVIGPLRKARAGWAAAFAEMQRRGDDALLDDPGPGLSSWDEDEWQWQ